LSNEGLVLVSCTQPGYFKVGQIKVFQKLRFPALKLVNQAADAVLKLFLLFFLLVNLFFRSNYFDPLALCFLRCRLGVELEQNLVNELDVHVDLHD
jgi:hypothetical protein